MKKHDSALRIRKREAFNEKSSHFNKQKRLKEQAISSTQKPSVFNPEAFTPPIGVNPFLEGSLNVV